jgi:hypothetical protein
MPLLAPNGEPIDAQAAVADAKAALENDTAVQAPLPCAVAFLVYQAHEGYWRAVDIDTEVVPDRKPNFDDMTAAASVILRESEPGLTYPDGPLPAVTAFIIYQLPEGLWQAAVDLDVPLQPGRTVIGSDIVAGLSVTLRDVQTQEVVQQATNAIVPNTVQMLINAQMEMGKKMAEAREAQAIAAELEKDKKRRGGR